MSTMFFFSFFQHATNIHFVSLYATTFSVFVYFLFCPLINKVSVWVLFKEIKFNYVTMKKVVVVVSCCKRKCSKKCRRAQKVTLCCFIICWCPWLFYYHGLRLAEQQHTKKTHSLVDLHMYVLKKFVSVSYLYLH